MKLISMPELVLSGLFSGQLLLAQSANRPPIPLKDLFDHLKISGATISPDGKRLAFLHPKTNASTSGCAIRVATFSDKIRAEMKIRIRPL
jgi:hypothetical protein